LDKTRPTKAHASSARLAKAPRRVGGSTGGFSKAWALALILALTHITTAGAQTAPGTVISNTATLSYGLTDGAHSKQSNTVSVTTVGAHNHVPSTIEFLAYEPGSPLAKGLPAGPTLCSVDGGTTFNPLPAPAVSGNKLNALRPLGLAPTSLYNQGDVLFIELNAPDQNQNPAAQDTAVISVSVPSLHETVTLQLTETGPNTGLFVGYLPTGAGACSLQAGANSHVQANYSNPFFNGDDPSATALVDPFGVVFDSSTGKPLDGAVVTLVDANTGKPVKVLGKDGVSSYPATVTSGTSAKDSYGATYKVPTGGFLFPTVQSGKYRLQVQPPADYHSPSVVAVSQLETLPGAPYTLPAASFGGVATQAKAGILEVDYPLDPVSASLLLQKTASVPDAAVGDVMQFTITAQNTSTTLPAEGVVIADQLPQGFRYMKGSTRLGGVAAADPVISANGQELRFNIGSVAASASVSFTYAVQLTAATPLTTVVNSAQAFEGTSAVSNVATAAVEVQSDFLQNVNTLIGRVVVGCDTQAGKGVEGARVVLENGSYAVTDHAGDYHFQAVNNGTHVAQLDLASLPKGYEPMSCEHNTRWAGRDYSQFVELHGGALWRADFHVRPIPGAEGDLGLQLSQAPVQGHVHNTVQLTVSDVPVNNLSTTVVMPAGMTYMKGSASLDGQPQGDPQDLGDGMLVFRLGAHQAGWKGALEFDSLLPALQPAAPATHQQKSFIIEGFPSGKVELNDHDRQVMQQIADLIKDSANISMTFIGYTDDVPVAAGSQYANNIELSVGRAQAVAGYLQSHIDTDGAQIFISGRGENDPLASNDSEEGRAKNRRTEIDVQYDEKADAAAAANTVYQTRAIANFDSPSAKSQHTPAAAVMLHALPAGEMKEKDFTLQDFAAGSTSLSDRDQAALEQVAALIKGSSHVSLTFVGYADNQQIASGSKYANNMELSVARAQAAADFAKAHVDIDGAQVFIVGRGDSQGSDGDAQAGSRSTVIKVDYQEVDPAALAADAGQSDVQHAAVKGLSPADQPDAQPAASPADTATTDKDKLADTFEVDGKWLQAQTEGTPQFVWPSTDYLPAIPAIHVAVEHGPKQKVILSVNGEEINKANFMGATRNSQGTAAVSQWIGVPLVEGNNKLVAVVMDGDQVVQRLERTVHFSGTPIRAEFLADKSTLLADGRTAPVFAVRFFDRWGYPARRGLAGHFQIQAPYQGYQDIAALQAHPLSSEPGTPDFAIGEGGIAYLKLAPTTESGEVVVTLPLQGDSYQQLRGWMHAADRDWILVGVASGTAAFDKIKNNMQSLQGDDPNSDIYQDGKIAFYAKGTIQGGYLLTTSYDSSKAGGVLSSGLQQAVNPNSYFMLYGDASQQGFDASSSQKLYIKIERGQFYAMFGDYDTGLTVTQLSRYDRQFTGAKSVYQGDRFGYTAFAAQNDQAYVQDEIQGNGTSGLYYLSHKQLLINSDRVSIEIRDRYTNAVISEQPLTAFVDYTVDYFGGTIFFKQPVPARDPNFNPEYIVAEYEVVNGAGNAITAGGRGSVKFNDGKVELGATAVSEGTGDGTNRLTGTDVKVQVTQSTLLTAEVSHTANGPNGAIASVGNLNGTGLTSATATTSNSSASAYRVELNTQSLKVDNDLFLNNEAPGFGLGQQNLGDSGERRLGDQGRYKLDDHWSVTGSAISQQSLTQDVNQGLASAGVQYKTEGGDSVGTGLQHSQTSFAAPQPTPTLLGGTAQGDYSSNQVLVNGTYNMLDKRLVLHGDTQTGVGGGAGDPSNPNMTTVGADYKLNPKVAMFIDEQVASGGGQSDRSTDVGVKTEPWSHGELSESVSQESTEYGPHLYSTMGLGQGWDVTSNLSLSAGYQRVASMHSPNFPATGAASGTTGSTVTPIGASTPIVTGTGTTGTATAPTVGTFTSDFNSLFVGGSYHLDAWAMNARIEAMNSDVSTTRNLFAGFYRTLSPEQAFSASLQAFHSVYGDSGVSDNVDGRLGYAYRADESRWSWLEQLDLIYANQAGLQGLPEFASPTGVTASQESASTLANNLQTVSTYGLNMKNWKLVNNLQSNYTLTDRFQLSMYYGSKLARFAFDSGSYQGYTDIIGSEFRYDLQPKWDVGFLASRIHSWSAGTVNGSYGVESGWQVGTNAWISVGYNFSGFYDPDFTANHYTAKGLFLRFRFKFDQDTIKDWATPGKVALPEAP